MFTITIQIPQDVLNAGEGVVLPAMYGELLASYTTQSGQQIPANTWVYYTGSDYAAASGVANVTAYTSYTTTDSQTLALPDVPVASAHLIFGIGSLPAIPVNGSGQPQQPIPAMTPTVYDFVEFTYNTSDALFINTTMIDQFGVPIEIQINPSNSNLPQGAGVTVDRADVLSQFQSDVAGSPFLQCTQDLFGNTLTTRILSPNDAINGNCVQGVVANAGNAPPSTLAAGTYYYAVTALDEGGTESVAQPNVVVQTVTQSQAVTIAWSPNANQPAGINSYNVYRGTPSEDSVTWGLIGNALATSFSAGGAFSDTGQTPTNQTPPMNPLLTYFDSQVQSFFASYQQTGNQLYLTATDGTSDGYVYSFQGTTVTEPTYDVPCLQLLLTSVVDSTGSSVNSPPIPLQTPFNVYVPYWSTNSYNLNNPSPPSWAAQYAPYQSPASAMVFGASGVFADNTEQPVPSTVPSNAVAQYQTLLGSLENQIVAALTRGIANLSIAPTNWGSTAPVQTQPTLASGSSSLTAGTTYYYVVTAVYDENGENEETAPSLEFNATPTEAEPCVQVSWEPLNGPASFNVYRGTASQQEDVLVANVSNSSGNASSYTDTGSVTSQNGPPYVYFPPNVPSDLYDQFFHQPSISLNGAAYAAPFDDQGNQSSTLSSSAPVSVSITLGSWEAS